MNIQACYILNEYVQRYMVLVTKQRDLAILGVKL